MSMIRAAAGWLADLVFPKFCAGCGQEGDFCCRDCRATLSFLVPACPVCSKRNFTGILCDPCAEKMHLRRLLAPFSYADPLVRKLIHYYKYLGARELAALFAGELARFLGSFDVRPAGPAVLVPVPLHPRRERERGFNQARLIAAELGSRLGLPVAEALRRRRATDPQVSMDSFERRRENVRDAFSLRAPEAVAGKTVILVDDVSTSGATLAAAAWVLREGGVRTVWAVVVARG